MTKLKRVALPIIAVGFVVSGCTSAERETAEVDPPAPPPVAVVEPVPEVVEEPEAVEVTPIIVEEPVVVEPESVVLVEPADPQPPPEVVEPETITILGTIKYVELEGGFFGIITEDGAKYFPEYLEPDFKVDGLSIRVVARPQEQILGIQMWGTPIEVLKIEAN